VTCQFKVFIPARFASTRLPGKPLLMIGQRTLIEHVYRSAARSAAGQVIIVTDDDRIEDVARSFGATVIMTSGEHQSGTDRINEAVVKLGIPDGEIIVNVQGDEFGLSPDVIDKVADALNKYPDRDLATLCEKITDVSVYRDPNSVKVVRDLRGLALYFSRSPIPWVKQEDNIAGRASKHIGIYACRAGFLRKFAALPRSELEQAESLEQLRALAHGYRIHVEEIAQKTGVDINTEDDLVQARKLVKSGKW
jgi:3-deoxy-manno-octulosonate cytidylyltransferase (CMP-KDO synthetase)